jgi:hypothetical protein
MSIEATAQRAQWQARTVSACEFLLGAFAVIGPTFTTSFPTRCRSSFGGFGEEISYRGYLLNKLANAFGRTQAADVIAILGSAVLFGYGHYYKGPAGILDSGVAGVILGTAYLVSGRNLWTCVLAHGFIDTFAVFAA